MNIFYRKDESGNASLLYSEDGVPVFCMPGVTHIYPVGSELSCAYDHPEGITLTIADAESLGIEADA